MRWSWRPISRSAVDRPAAADHRRRPASTARSAGRQIVEPGRHQAPQRVGQRRRRGRWSAPPPSPSSRLTSSSRKNGLPPLRSSSASRDLGGDRDRRRGARAARRRPPRPSGSRWSVTRCGGRAGASSRSSSAGRAVATITTGQWWRRSKRSSMSCEDRVVGPVQVGDLRAPAGGGGPTRSRYAPRARARPPRGRVAGSAPGAAPRSRAGEQALGGALDLGVGGRRPQASATGGADLRAGLGRGWRRRPTSSAGAQGIGHRPPDVGLAVGHAAALADDGAVGASAAAAATSSASRLLPMPTSPTSSDQQRPGRGGSSCRWRWRRRPTSCVAADEGHVDAAGPVPRRQRRRRGPRQVSTGSSRPLAVQQPTGLVGDGVLRWRRRWPARPATSPGSAWSGGGWRCSPRRPWRCTRPAGAHARPPAPRRC